MSEKIAFSLEITGADAQVAALDKVEKELKDVTKQRNLLIKSQEKGIKLTDKEKVALSQNKKSLTELTKEQIRLKGEKTKANQVVKASITGLNSEKGSLNSLSAQLLIVDKKWRALSRDERLNQKVGKDLTAQKTRLTAALKKEEIATGDARRNVGNYAASMQGAVGQLGFMPPALTRVVTGMNMLTVATSQGTKAMRIFKFALAATGIGLLIVAIGSLIQFFRRTEEGASKLQQILAPMGVTLGNLGDLAGDLGEAIIGMFENPKDAALAFVNFLKDQVLVRINSMIKLFGLAGKIMSNVFSGEFAKAADNLKEAGKTYADVLTGIEDTTGKIVDIGKGIADGIKENIREGKVAVQLEKDKLELHQRRRVFLVDEAKIQTEISRLRLIANDKDIDALIRIKAINGALAMTEQLADERIEIKEEELRLLKDEAELSDSSGEVLDEIAEKEREIILLRKTQFDMSKLMVTRRTSINNEIQKQIDLEQKLIESVAEKAIEMEEKITEARNKSIQERADAAMEEEFDLEEEEFIPDEDPEVIADDARKVLLFQNTIKFEAEKAAIEQSSLTARFEKLKQDFDNRIILEEEYNAKKKLLDNEVLNSKLKVALQVSRAVMAIADRESIAFKAAAIVQTGISTYVSSTAAYASASVIPVVGWILGPIAAAAAIVAGLSSVAKIAGLDFEEGGFIQGARHSGGGVDINAEEGEIIFSRKSVQHWGASNLLDMNRQGNKFESGGFIASTSQRTQELSDESVDRLINGINNKQVINDPVEALEAQNEAIFIQNNGDI